MLLELITIGDELLLGFTVDTNAAWLARALAAMGVTIVRRATVPDDAAVIAGAVREALERTGAVLTTGGLGPTADDLTRGAVAEVFGRPLQLDAAVAAGLEARWRDRGLPGELPAANRQQAMVPDGATVLPNRHGTAPGLWLEDDGGRWVVMLPGVPREMRGLWQDEVEPRLRVRLRATEGSVVLSRALRTTGVPESVLADRIGDAMRGFGDLALAFLPGRDGVDLRVTARGGQAAEAGRRAEAALAALRARVGDEVIYGQDDTDLAAVVLDGCRARGWRLAVAESCTGGLLGARLTEIPGSSDVVLGGIIAYANEVKVRELGVREADLAAHGAVSEPVAVQMAAGARARFGCEVGIGITGVAGPGGGSVEKPVGTVWIAVDVEGARRAVRTRFIGDRAEIRWRAAQAALDMVRRLTH